MYGWVQKQFTKNDKYETGGPVPYDEETDSNATVWGYFDSVEEAMRCVEENYSTEIFI